MLIDLFSKVTASLSAGFAEARRAWVLCDWEPGMSVVEVWPEQLDLVGLYRVAKELGLGVDWPSGFIANTDDGRPAVHERFWHLRWKLTTEKGPCGVCRAGVAVCTNDDRYRQVIVLEPLTEVQLEPTVPWPRC